MLNRETAFIIKHYQPDTPAEYISILHYVAAANNADIFDDIMNLDKSNIDWTAIREYAYADASVEWN